MRAVAQAAQIWRNGVVRDLTQEVTAKLEATTGTKPEEAPAEGGGDAQQGAASE